MPHRVCNGGATHCAVALATVLDTLSDVEALNPDCGHPTQRRVVAPAISRRALIATIAGSLLAAVKAPAGPAAPARFGFREVARKAEALAGRGYTPGPISRCEICQPFRARALEMNSLRSYEPMPNALSA